MTTYTPTAEDMLADMRDRLARARADLKRATRSGYGQEGALATVCTLAGLLATHDPALQDDVQAWLEEQMAA